MDNLFFFFFFCSDGVRAEGSKQPAEEREGRPEPDDPGAESADDRWVSPPAAKFFTSAAPIKKKKKKRKTVCHLMIGF